MLMHKIEYVDKNGKYITELYPDIKTANKAAGKARENGCQGGYVMRSRVIVNVNSETQRFN